MLKYYIMFSVINILHFHTSFEKRLQSQHVGTFCTVLTFFPPNVEFDFHVLSEINIK